MRTSIPAFFGLLLVALLAVACAPASAPAPSAQEQVINDNTPTFEPGGNEDVRDALIGQPSGDVDTGRQNIQSVLSTDSQALVQKGKGQHVNGYSYTYTKTVAGRLASEPTNQPKVWQRGTMRKVEFARDIQLEPEFFAYYVMLSENDQTAIAYCSQRKCGWSPGQAPITRTVAYADYDFMTPSDWLTDMVVTQELGSETMSGRATLKLATTTNGASAVIWIDRFSGLPLQVETGDTRITYTNLVLGVNDREIAP